MWVSGMKAGVGVRYSTMLTVAERFDHAEGEVQLMGNINRKFHMSYSSTVPWLLGRGCYQFYAPGHKHGCYGKWIWPGINGHTVRGSWASVCDYPAFGPSLIPGCHLLRPSNRVKCDAQQLSFIWPSMPSL
jgi:hypothetical protein